MRFIDNLGTEFVIEPDSNFSNEAGLRLSVANSTPISLTRRQLIEMRDFIRDWIEPYWDGMVSDDFENWDEWDDDYE